MQFDGQLWLKKFLHIFHLNGLRLHGFQTGEINQIIQTRPMRININLLGSFLEGTLITKKTLNA